MSPTGWQETSLTHPILLSIGMHVEKKYAKFGAGRPAVGAVLVEGGQKKALYGLVSRFLSRLWDFNFSCIILTVLTEFQFSIHLSTWLLLQDYPRVLENPSRPQNRQTCVELVKLRKCPELGTTAPNFAMWSTWTKLFRSQAWISLCTDMLMRKKITGLPQV